MLDRLLTDLRYGLRQMARAPVFTLVASVSLGVGITVAVAMFAVLNSVLFKPLPVPDPDRIVHVYTSHYDSDDLLGGSSYADHEDFRDGGGFESLAAHFYMRLTVATADRAPVGAMVGFVSPTFFQTLGVPLQLGAPFGVGGDHAQIVISDRYWHRAFDADPGVIGTEVRANGIRLTVVGVAPESFRGLGFGYQVIGWVPAQLLPVVSKDATILTKRFERARPFNIVGRIPRGSSIEYVRARMAQVTHALSQQDPAHWVDNMKQPRVVTVLTHRENIAATNQWLMAVLNTIAALVLFVLALACTNVAGLLMARAIARRHEIAVRLALGATRARLMLQLLTESTLLALLGGTVGLFGSLWAIRLLARYPYFDRFDLTPDWRVLTVTLSVSILCALLFGIVPAQQSLRVNLKSGFGSQAVSAERSRVRGALIAFQVAISCVLILLAFNAARGVRSSLSVDMGFDPSSILLVTLGMKGVAIDSIQQVDYVLKARETLRAIPGVERVTGTSRPPPYEYTGHAFVAFQKGPSRAIAINTVGADFFETVGIPLISGRTIQDRDIPWDYYYSVVVVNRAFVEQFGREVLEQTLGVQGGHRGLSIVGVVDDAKHQLGDGPTEPRIYVPQGYQWWTHSYTAQLIARIKPGMERSISTAFTRPWRDRYPDAVPPFVESLTSRLEARYRTQRLIARTTFGVGAVELALATVGLYSLLLFALLARSQEIGVRLALGARPLQATWAVMGSGLGYAAIGGACGLLLGIPASLWAANRFAGSTAADPMPFLAAAAAILVSTAAAAYLPARRAARLQPAIALRHE